MKILHVTGSMNPGVGGTCQGIRNMISGLATRNVQSEVVCVDSGKTAEFPEDPFELHFLGPAVTPWCFTQTLADWLYFNLPRFDVVIIHGSWLYPGFAAFNAWQQLVKTALEHARRIRLYLMPHGMLDPYFQHAPGRKLKALRNWLYWKLIEGKVVSNADGVLFTCQEELRAARGSFSPYRPKSELNAGFGIPSPPPFTDTMKDALVRQFGSSEEPYYLFMGRIHEKKGLDILLEAYRLLIRKQQAVPRLVIAGPGLESEYGQRLRRMVEISPGMEERVTFTGMLTGELKWAVLYGCQAFMLPSHQENFGIAIVEALACGKPVIISDKVNIWREATESGSGLVATDQVNDYLEAWNAFAALSEPQKRRMGHAALHTFQQRFSMEKAAGQLIACFS